ncbi:MAG TPA: gamma-glutamylcyclotransferase family protein [Kofleriaceae bacterium]|nr:gamma-glutamylcyclotransferase family protein [Kofleriaceae bacterium]
MARKERRRPGWSTAAQEIVDRLFVYGTLRQGQQARALIAQHVAGSEPATMRGRIYAMPEGYPGFVAPADGADDAVVHGELVTLTDLAAAFALLDAYEGNNFSRVLRQAEAAGANRWTWVYELTPPSLADAGVWIASGTWSDSDGPD